MKKKFIAGVIISLLAINAWCQTPVKAIIRLKDGKTIDAVHFGKLNCESNPYVGTSTTLRGKFSGSLTEINDYKDISKLIFSGFTLAPVASVGNQKAMITVIKKNGVSVPLEEAELVMSCYGPADRYNEIHVQILNPLTNVKVDMTIEVRNIESVTF
jgi:hypothetical protein